MGSEVRMRVAFRDWNWWSRSAAVDVDELLSLFSRFLGVGFRDGANDQSKASACAEPPWLLRFSAFKSIFRARLGMMAGKSVSCTCVEVRAA